MLKIKDDVPLEKLKKFGFELEKRNKQYWEYKDKIGTIHYVFMNRKMWINTQILIMQMMCCMT